MNRYKTCCIAGLIVFWLTAVHAWSDEPADNTAHTIFGIVSDRRSSRHLELQVADPGSRHWPFNSKSCVFCRSYT